jgi:hypothetical protein
LENILAKLAIVLFSLQIALGATATPKTGIWDGYPILKRICAAESNYSPDNEPRQFLPDGSIEWGWDGGKIVKRDVGACQLNTKVWGDTAKAMGLDIMNSEADNIAFAQWLYDHYSWHPWLASKRFWDPNDTIQ